MSGEEFKEGDLMPWQEMTTAIKNLQVFNDEHTERLQGMERKIKELEGILKTYFSESPSSRIAELEARVDSLTRSLDFIQNDIGIEVAVTPRSDVSAFQQKSTHEGQCELCDRIAPLNGGNICEGCFYEELYNEANLAL